MTTVAFISAVLALLLAPGPTNTLMGLAGAQGGIGRVLRFIPAELAGYLATILPLVWLGQELLATWPSAALLLKLVAATWVMFLAVRLWGVRSDGGATAEVTGLRILVTTMLNPKALIFGLVLLPAPQSPQFPGRMALFLLAVTAVGLIWGGAGAITRQTAGGSHRLHLLQRAASVWLAIVSVTLVAGVLRV